MGKESIEELELLYKNYKAKGDYKSAFYTLKKIDELQSEIYDKEKLAKLKKIEVEYRRKQKNDLLRQEERFNKELEEKDAELNRVMFNQKNTELHLKSLQLQLSPHFIFNTLQAIQSFIFQEDADLTSDYIAQFANMMRAILNASEKSNVRVDEEVELLQTYLYLEQRRFEFQFAFEIHVEGIENPRDYFLPSLLLQPFVENAILHGVGNQNDGQIEVVFRGVESGLYIHILDNGIGRKAASKIEKRTHQGTSTALKILKEREILSNDSKTHNFRFRIRDRKKAKKIVGTHVIIQVNYLK